MKKKLFILLAIFAVMILGSTALFQLTNRDSIVHEEDEFVIVTSFYPMYILASNLTNGIQGVKVVNLTENQTGCLHDYQLTTKDMIQLDEADLFVINGGGMESFAQEVVSSYPELEVITASSGITMLDNETEHNHDIEELDHEHEEDGDEEHNHEDDEHTHDTESEDTHTHDHGEYNAHVWMNINDYLIELENVYEAFIQRDSEHASLYEKNYDSYKKKVENLRDEYDEILQNVKNKEIVIFHDAFAYMAKQIGLEVVYTINLDDDTYLSAKEVKEIIDEVNLHQIKVLFTEAQYSDSIAESIAIETNAQVYVIDSLVTGDGNLDSYINGMRNNLEVLQQALYAN